MGKTRTPEPVTVSVIRLGKTSKYELADKLDWSLMFSESVLEIKTSSGKVHYWPLDSVTQWIVEPLQNGHA